MKIGIMTLTGTSNYGAVLQIHALQKVLEQHGQDCETIAYDNPVILMDHKPDCLFRKKGIKKKIKAVLAYRAYAARYRKFQAFEQAHCRFSTVHYTKETIQEANSVYDCFVAGSDQIWNYDITGKDPNYFLAFASADKCLCSYAASSGKDSLSEAELTAALPLLSRYDVLSVREDRLRRSLSASLPEAAAARLRTDIDPTLLLDQDYWKQFVGARPIQKPYIFLYLFRETEKSMALLQALQKKTGCEIVYASKYNSHKHRYTYVSDLSPAEFLNYIYHAAYVMTGSFHAMCFSVQFEKEFFLTGSAFAERNERLYSLVRLLGIQNRTMDDLTDHPAEIDYPAVKRTLAEMRAESMRTISEICERDKG